MKYDVVMVGLVGTLNSASRKLFLRDYVFIARVELF